MAKQRRANSIEAAIGAVTSAIRAEADPNLSAEQKQVIVNGAMDLVDNSGVITMAEHADDNIETIHQVDEIFDGAGRNRVELQRQGAIDGAIATVNTITEQDEQAALEANAEQDEFTDEQNAALDEQDEEYAEADRKDLEAEISEADATEQ